MVINGINPDIGRRASEDTGPPRRVFKHYLQRYENCERTRYVIGQDRRYLLIIVSDPDIGRCASEDDGPPMKVFKHF